MGSKQSTENKNSATMPDFFNFEEDFFYLFKKYIFLKIVPSQLHEAVKCILMLINISSYALFP